MLRYSPSLEFWPTAAPFPNAAIVQYESHTANSSHVSKREHTKPSDSVVADSMKQSRLQSLLDIVREANREAGAAVPLGEFLEQIQRERYEFEAALENLVVSAAARLMESLVQALLDSQPTSYSSKATQTDSLQTTPGNISKATQTDAVQPPRKYGSEATQTDTLDAPTPKEDSKKIAKSENTPVQALMVQQSPRGSRAKHTDITQPVSQSLPDYSNSTYEKYLKLVRPPERRTLPGESSIPGRVHTRHSDEQELPASARLRQADPGFNVGNGSISVKSTIDEAMERYHTNSRTLKGARTVASQSKQKKAFTQTSLGIDSPLENGDTSHQTPKLLHGKSPLKDTADHRLDTARRDMAARGSTPIGLPYGSTPMPDPVMGPTLRTRNGLTEVDNPSISGTEDLNNFSTYKTAGGIFFSRGERIVCLPGYAPLDLTPPITPRRTSADVINLSRKEMETTPDVQTLTDVAYVEKVEQQELKPAEVSEVVVDGHNVNGHNLTEEKPKLTPRKSPILVAQKKLHVKNVGPDRFLGLLDLVKRK